MIANGEIGKGWMGEDFAEVLEGLYCHGAVGRVGVILP